MFKSSRLNLFSFFFIFFLGGIIGFAGREVYTSLFPYSLKDIKFIEACGELNEKELTFENLKTLDSYVIVNPHPLAGGPDSFEEKYFNQYLEYLETGVVPSEFPKINIYESRIFFTSDSTVEPTWYCELKVGKETGRTTAKAYFNPED